jgi:L-threonine-O-3-phosphate decarboxylase
MSGRAQGVYTAHTDEAVSPRPEIMASPLAHHGALDYAELAQLGLDPESVLDFSVNSNPYGPSPKVREALATVPLDRYPDREALSLRRALADHLHLSQSQIVAGNGTAELLWLAALAYIRPGDRVLVIGPTFGEYARVAALMGAQVETWTARPEQDFAVELDAVAHCLERLQPRLAFLCTPNNPTGRIVPREAIATWARVHRQTLFVVDEAYLAFAAGLNEDTCAPSALAAEADNILVLRSMTKDYALAGLRLGYAAGHEEVITALARVRPPWSVNSMAQAAGLAALEDEAHLKRSLGKLARAREALIAGLRKLGLTISRSDVHFFLMRVGDGAAFRRALLQRRIQVRDCASFGLPAYVRIATRRPAENARLLVAIQKVI